MMASDKQLKIGAILSYLAIFISILTGLLFTPWMVKQIGQNAYGLYTLANSVITMFLLDFGLSTATSKFVAKYRAQGELDKVNNYLGAIYKLYLLITVAIFFCLLVFYFCIDYIYINLLPFERKQFKVVYIIAALYAVVNFPCVTFNGILNAYEKFIQLKLIDILYRLSFVVLTAVALLEGMGLYALVSIHAATGFLAILVKWMVIKRSTSVRVNLRYQQKGLYKEIFAFSFWVTVSSIAQRASFNFSPTVLGVTVKNAAEAISVFGIITTIESYAYSIPGAINGMFLPRVSQIYAEESTHKLSALMNNVGRFQFALNSLVTVGFILVGDEFINLWMGPAYRDAYIGIILVIIPGVFYNSLQIAHTTMIVANKIKYKAFVDCGMAAMNVVLAFALSFRYGVLGVCAAICVAYIFRVIILIYLYKKYLPVGLGEFIKVCFFRMSVPGLATMCLGIPMDVLVGSGRWLLLCVKIMAISVAYMLFVLLVGITKQERKLLLNVVKTRIGKG